MDQKTPWVHIKGKMLQIIQIYVAICGKSQLRCRSVTG